MIRYTFLESEFHKESVQIARSLAKNRIFENYQKVFWLKFVSTRLRIYFWTKRKKKNKNC